MCAYNRKIPSTEDSHFLLNLLTSTEGAVKLSFESSLTLKDVEGANKGVTEGEYEPTDCTARQSVAILIPHRSRERHLLYLLHHLHPFLQRQQIHYAIYVIQQVLLHTAMSHNFHYKSATSVKNNKGTKRKSQLKHVTLLCCIDTGHDFKASCLCNWDYSTNHNVYLQIIPGSNQQPTSSWFIISGNCRLVNVSLK